MAKKQKIDFFNKASFGFFILLQGKKKNKKLSRDTLLLASEIGNFLSYREKMSQNTYLGTISDFCEDIPTEIVVKASNELLNTGYLIKKIDGKIELCQDYRKYKEEVELILEQRELSDFPNKDIYEVFKDYKELSWDGLYTWEEKKSFLRYKISDGDNKYSNFHNGFYKILIGKLIFNKFFIKWGPGKLQLPGDFLEREVSEILDIYFPMGKKPIYESKEYLKALKHIHFFTEKTIKEYQQKKLERWEDLKLKHPKHCEEREKREKRELSKKEVTSNG
jgi:hypothetical protein